MATSTIKKVRNDIYVDKASVKTYTIPLSRLQINHGYGMAIVGAWKNFYVLYYVSSEPFITKICGEYTCTVTLDGSNLILTFNENVWDGISILPL